MLPARLRSASGWSDACILNISSGGLLIFSKAAAVPGSRVEIRRGGTMVIARVAWRENQRIGLASEHVIAIEEIVSPELANAALPATFGVAVERRNLSLRPVDSRTLGRRMEFVTAIIIGMGMAGLAAASVQSSLARPLQTVALALRGH